LSSPHWVRGVNGHIETTIGGANIRGRIRFDTAAFRSLMDRQASALMASRVVDGVALRGWGVDTPQRLALIKAVRHGVGQGGLIALESGELPVLSGPYANGLIVEDDGKGKPVWPTFAATSEWARDHLRNPSFTALDALAPRARNRLYDMRMETTYALVFSDGFVSFGDAEGHDWYEFWSPSLGRPVRATYRKGGAYRREFQFGTVIFNPPTNPTVIVDFPLNHTSVAKSIVTRSVSVQPGDGDILLSRPAER
jgi:hypothetical protein